MKFFNTAGPVNKEKHYKIDPLSRWDLEEILCLIDQEKYFIMHAPRQTGKTLLHAGGRTARYGNMTWPVTLRRPRT